MEVVTVVTSRDLGRPFRYIYVEPQAAKSILIFFVRYPFGWWFSRHIRSRSIVYMLVVG